ncbi:MAG: HAD-IIA family hydrolase [Bacilli bacterium]|nr:HAD-IIA family hydrolase [Bacilli bacterium]
MNIKDIDAVLFDLDGTIYYGSKIIPGANETIAFFRNNGKKVFFTTNNSTKTRKQIYERLINMGVDCHLEEVLTSGYLASLVAKQRRMKDIYIFGSKNLIDEFTEQGIVVNQEETAKNLLIGYDPEMTYAGLTKALQVALHAKLIIACNRERVYPGENARMMPGCGAMTAPIEWCANRECDLIVGKPNSLMIELLSSREKISPERLLVVGDTYESDIIMANSAGSLGILLSKERKFQDTVTVDSIADVPSVFK